MSLAFTDRANLCRRDNGIPETTNYNYLNSVFYVIGTFCQQGNLRDILGSCDGEEVDTYLVSCNTVQELTASTFDIKTHCRKLSKNEMSRSVRRQTLVAVVKKTSLQFDC